MAMSKPSQPINAFNPLAFRVEDACRMIGIGKTKLYELMASGDLAKVKIGKITLIPRASLEALLEKGVGLSDRWR